MQSTLKTHEFMACKTADHSLILGGSVYRGIGGSIYRGIGGSVYRGISGSVCAEYPLGSFAMFRETLVLFEFCSLAVFFWL